MNDLVNQNGSFYSYQEVGIDGSPLNILKYQGFIDSLKHFLSHTQIKLTKKVHTIHTKVSKVANTKSHQSLSATKVRDTGNV